MFSHLSLKAKLIGMCLALASLTAGIAIVDKLNVDSIIARNDHVIHVNVANLQTLSEMRVQFKQVRLDAFQAALEGLSLEERAAIGKGIDAAVAKYDEEDKKYLSADFQPGEEELYREVDRLWEEQRLIIAKIEKLLAAEDKESQFALTELLKVEFAQLAKIFDPAMDKLQSFHAGDIEKSVKVSKEAQTSAQRLSMLIAVSSIIFALILGYIVSRSLAITLGNLGKSLSEGSSSVASAAQQISESSVEASSASTQQAAALQQTVASIDEVNAMVGKNADNAKRSFEVSSSSKMAANRGKQAIDQMLASMDEIGRSNKDIMQQTEASNREISAIVKIIAEIGNKTKVINDIVFQTKLLSFNASVEAARAGEHGKGFAVVAEEVGNLAQMSGNAAKEISSMLEESIRKVESTVNETKSKLERLVNIGREKVEIGTVTAQSCGEALDEIVRQVSDLNHMVGEISTASREQALGVQEISKALGQIDQGMQQNTTVAEQSASASEELTNQALVLDSLVSRLVATVEGKGKVSIKQTTSTQVARTAKSSPKGTKANRVIEFRPKEVQRSSSAHPAKIAVGGEEFPADNDPRFEEV